MNNMTKNLLSCADKVKKFSPDHEAAAVAHELRMIAHDIEQFKDNRMLSYDAICLNSKPCKCNGKTE